MRARVITKCQVALDMRRAGLEYMQVMRPPSLPVECPEVAAGTKKRLPEGGPFNNGTGRSTDHQNVAYSAIRIATTPTAPMLKLGGVP